MLRGRVDTLTFRGARTAVLLDVRGLRLEAEVANIGGESPDWLEEGAEVSVLVSPRAPAGAGRRRSCGEPGAMSARRSPRAVRARLTDPRYGVTAQGAHVPGDRGLLERSRPAGARGSAPSARGRWSASRVAT